MTDNEIVKALTCFSFWDEGCNKCPHLKQCNKAKRILTTYDTIDALNLINRQKAEIEGLQKQLNNAEDLVNEKTIQITDYLNEIERLNKEIYRKGLL